MKILYYCWDEYTSSDIRDIFGKLNYEVTTIRYDMANKLYDEEFIEYVDDMLDSDRFDCIFSFDYYPVISVCSKKFKIKYISWVFDSTHLTLYSKTIFNPYTYVFSFDNNEVNKLKSFGVKNIYHMPLAVNVSRVNDIIKKDELNYKYDITFLGTLYDDEYNFYDQIKYFPPYYKGFFEAIINSQMDIYGIDLPEKMITDEVMENISSYVNIPLIEDFCLKERDYFIQIFQKKITVKERFEILQMISNKYCLTHFAKNTSPLFKNVDFRGYADYIKDMPLIFNESKINLNISLRCIQSGMPLRCLDIMGAGGFLLSNYQKELAYFFEPNKEIVLYDSRVDLMNKIEYYLNHDEEREEIAKRGREKVVKHFDYMKVVPMIFKIAMEKDI